MRRKRLPASLYRALHLAFCLGLCLGIRPGYSISPPAAAQDDFADIDRMLDARFDETNERIDRQFEAVKAAVDRAFRGLSRRIERTWGEDSRLPSRQEWVTYSDDLKTRLSVDYADAEVVLETLVDDPADMSAELESMRQLAAEVLRASDQELNDRDTLVQAIREEMQSEGLGKAEPDNAASEADVLPDGGSMLSKVLPEESVLATDKELSPGAVEVVEESGVTKARFRFAFSSDAQARLISSHLNTVREFSIAYEVPVSLILAIIETESSFNPRAVSPVPAFGLMQLVPRTAGIDAYQYVHGEKRLLTPEYLFREAQNIELGTAYLGLVRDRYLRGIDNPFSRYYCAVAAYNTGVGNVAKTFVGTSDLTAAYQRINDMTDQEVFNFLLAELPAQETRDYLLKIVDRVERYRHFDSG